MEKSEREGDAFASTADNGEKPRKYKGIQLRKWGKWVSEVRMPKTRAKIWLGSYDTAEQAARAFDAAVYCLRGPNAVFNFPNSIPAIPSASSLSREQIQVVAAKYAHGQITLDRKNNSKFESTQAGVWPSRSTSVSEMEASSDSQMVSREKSSAMGESFMAEWDDNQWSKLEKLPSLDEAEKLELMFRPEDEGSIFFDPTDLWSSCF